jgi:hypothetical protein
MNREIKVTDSIVDSIIDKFVDRATIGKQKYGKDLDRNDLELEEWLEHSIQEKMDDILYIQKALIVLREAKNHNIYNKIYKMEKDTLRMQFLSGVITESEYKVKLQENAII